MAQTLLVGTKKGVAILDFDDARASWTFRFDLMGWAVTASARDPQGRTYLAVASEIFGPALFHSDDLKVWTQFEAAPRYETPAFGNPVHHRLIAAGDYEGTRDTAKRMVDQIWALHATEDALYAGVSEAGLFVSRDRGRSWQEVEGLNDHPTRKDWEPGAGGLCAHTILSDGRNPDRLWVGISAAGFFRTDDGGRTWAQKSDGVPSDTGRCVHCVTHDPMNADRLYRQDHMGVYVSTDGGDGWACREDGLPLCEMGAGRGCAFGFPIALDIATGSLFVVPLNGDGFRMPADGRLTVYRSRDEGRSWTPLSNGLPERCFAGVLRGAMDADQGDPGGIYLGTTSGAVYGTNDLGESWQELATGLPRVLSVRAYSR